MSNRWIATALFAVLAAPLGAQAPVVMPSGNYVIQTRDTSSKADQVGMAGWLFTLKGNGNFIMTTLDTLPYSGKLVQKDGVATYTDQGCSEPGIYFVRKEGAGFAFDMKSETCTKGLSTLLFVPGKPRK